MAKIKESEVTAEEWKVLRQLELYWHEDWYIHYSGQILHVINYGDEDEDSSVSIASRLPSNITLIRKPTRVSSFVIPIYDEESDDISYYQYTRDFRLSDLERLLHKFSHKHKLDNHCFFEQPLTWEEVAEVKKCLIFSVDVIEDPDNTKIDGFIEKNDPRLRSSAMTKI